jgi:alpha-L-arabinofuranosidase
LAERFNSISFAICKKLIKIKTMNLKLRILSVSAFIFVVLAAGSQTRLTMNLNNKGVAISPTHYGIFFEDINHAADGGLYAELIKNRSFEDSPALDSWTKFTQTGASATALLETTGLLNSTQTKALKLSVIQATSTASAGVYNSGFWGINTVKGQQYQLTFYAKCDTAFKGTITASLESTGSEKYAQSTVTGLTTSWKKFTCTLTATGTNNSARFALSTNSPGTIWFDVVSLFPPTFNNRPNGCRPDLAQLLADMHPRFMRFPGGCFVEGDSLVNRFQWKKTIGNIENRPGHKNLWGYRTSDGMGFHEFLQLAEDIGAKPLYVTNIGVSHTTFQPYTALDDYIQDVLDALEYANGGVTTTYGAMRAANGHPEPFNIEYIEVGNENSWGDNYQNRFILFNAAIKAKYPTVQCIADGSVSPNSDYVDEHYYSSPDWFISQYNKYDSYSRTGSKVYTGEYAVTSNCGNGNLNAAIGEAAFMCGMEKNSDIVSMNSYAPIFVNNNDRAWNPDMIVYNASSVYCTPSYYVQKLFANNIGSVNITVKDSLNTKTVSIDGTGKIGLGTWSTQSDYSTISVTNSKGTSILSEPFASASNWTAGTGTWAVAGGMYSQSSTLTDCRSIAQTQISDSVYTYSLKARKTGGSEGFLIIFGCKDSNNFYWWNIGGWGNTKHAIEYCSGGSKSVVTSVSGSISSNLWYDIRIEVSTTQVRCYLNNVLIHTLTTSTTPLLYTSATLDESTNQLFLKVVNPQTTDVSSIVNLNATTATRLNGSATVLTSASTSNENSFTAPTNIAPYSSNVDTIGNTLKYTFKANSVTILKLNTSGSTIVSTLKNESNQLSVYPNPAKNILYIKGDKSSNISVLVSSLTGQTLIKKQTANGQVDISGLKSGVYILTTQQGNKLVSTGLMKE